MDLGLILVLDWTADAFPNINFLRSLCTSENCWTIMQRSHSGGLKNRESRLHDGRSVDRDDERVYLKLINGNPGVLRKVLEHRDEKLETADPMADQQDHEDEVENAHEDAGETQELYSMN